MMGHDWGSLPLDGVALVVLAGLLLLATVGGFWAGVWCAPLLQERALRRAFGNVRKLLELTTTEFERCGRMCQQLSTAAKEPLESGLWQRLERARQQVADAWRSLSEQQTAFSTRPIGDTCVTGPTPFEMNWVREPVDAQTQLPDRSAFDANLQQLLASSSQNCHPSGVLLVRIDKADQLSVRYGPSAAYTLQSKLAEVVTHSVREGDLVCRLGSDLFGILLPAVTPLAGLRVAETTRAAVREHTFRLDDADRAILLTASFGYAACLPGDAASLVYDRAAEALDKSQQAGRNQLHLHDGSQRVVARIG